MFSVLPEREETTGSYRKLRNIEPRNCNSSSNITRMIKPRNAERRGKREMHTHFWSE
jgi:hypothetical protein